MFKILISNDDQMETAFLKGLLAEEGYQVEVSQGIKETLHNIAFKSYQALILGVDVEGRKGMEVIPSVRAVDKDIPIITIVGQDSIETQKKVREQKIFYYFVRPVNPQELKAVLERVFLKSKSKKFSFQDGRFYHLSLDK